MTELDPSINPFAAPGAAVQDIAAPAGSIGVLAGRGARLGAACIDYLVVLAILLVVYLTTSINFFVPDLEDIDAQGLWALAFVAGSSLLLQGYLLHTRCQTVGKIAMSIRVSRGDGSKPGIGRLILLRILPLSLMGMIPFIGGLVSLVDSLLIFRESRRCLHDDIADTIVVRV